MAISYMKKDRAKKRYCFPYRHLRVTAQSPKWTPEFRSRSLFLDLRETENERPISSSRTGQSQLVPLSVSLTSYPTEYLREDDT